MTKRRGLGLFFALTFGLTWGIGALYGLAPGWVTSVFGPVSLTNPLAFAAVWSPTLSAIAVTLALRGPRGLAALLGAVLRWRVGWRWYALAVGVPALTGVLAGLAGTAMGAPPLPVLDVARWPMLLAAAAAHLLLDPGPLGEELGWRGFALPRMLAGSHPVRAGVVLGLIWALWHLPAFLIPGMPQAQLPIAPFVVSIVAVSVLMTWLYVNTAGSVLMTVLVHWAFNAFCDLHAPTAYLTAAILAAAAGAVTITTRGTLGQSATGFLPRRVR